MKKCWVMMGLALLLSPCSAEMKQPVATDNGLVKGVAARDASIIAFKGIPYAESPVGDLRWAAPHPPQNLSVLIPWLSCEKCQQRN